MSPLTAAQFKLLNYLRSCETCPSFDEMREALGLKSKSGVHRLVTSLEERGYLKRIANRARCLELLPDPELPSTRTLSAIPTTALAAEARRRGLVLGEFHRWTARIGNVPSERRRFVEVAR
jgi:SOS-response transcriptional repressor LexA